MFTVIILLAVVVIGTGLFLSRSKATDETPKSNGGGNSRNSDSKEK